MGVEYILVPLDDGPLTFETDLDSIFNYPDATVVFDLLVGQSTSFSFEADASDDVFPLNYPAVEEETSTTDELFLPNYPVIDETVDTVFREGVSSPYDPILGELVFFNDDFPYTYFVGDLLEYVLYGVDAYYDTLIFGFDFEERITCAPECLIEVFFMLDFSAQILCELLSDLTWLFGESLRLVHDCTAYAVLEKIISEQVSATGECAGGRSIEETAEEEVTLTFSLSESVQALLDAVVKFRAECSAFQTFGNDLAYTVEVGTECLIEHIASLVAQATIGLEMEEQAAAVLLGSATASTECLIQVIKELLCDDEVRASLDFLGQAALLQRLTDSVRVFKDCELTQGVVCYGKFRPYQPTVCLRTEIKGASFYSFNFSSAVEHDGTLYFALEDGIYMEEEASDSGELVFSGHLSPGGLVRTDAVFVDGEVDRNPYLIQRVEGYTKLYEFEGNKVLCARGLRGRKHLYATGKWREIYSMLLRFYKSVRRLK